MAVDDISSKRIETGPPRRPGPLMAEGRELLAVCPLDGRYSAVEIQWLQQVISIVGKQSLLLNEADREFLTSLQTINLDEAREIKELEAETNHDVKAVEYFVKKRLNVSRLTPDLVGANRLQEVQQEAGPWLYQLSGRESLNSIREFVHLGCTSEDINNAAYALMLSGCWKEILKPSMIEIVRHFGRLAKEWSDIPLLALTHGQPATPTTLGKEFGVYCVRLAKQLQAVNAVRICAKFNGAVGNFNTHALAWSEVDWPRVAKNFIHSLGIHYQPFSTQIESHDYIAEFSDALAHFQTILLGACQDIWFYISRECLQLRVVDWEVGSSTMPHKVNPIDFENAEGNLGLSNALLRFFATKLPISRMQRDLSDSTVLRSIGSALGYSLVAFSSIVRGLNKIRANRHKLERQLDDHWEVLAEPIQTLLRKDGFERPYELLKEETRGRVLDKARIEEIINTVFSSGSSSKELLASLTPAGYIGLASQLTNEMLTAMNQLLAQLETEPDKSTV